MPYRDQARGVAILTCSSSKGLGVFSNQSFKRILKQTDQAFVEHHPPYERESPKCIV